MKTVLVIGGGITGLCTMHYLKRLLQSEGKEANLILVEKNDYVGGGLHSSSFSRCRDKNSGDNESRKNK